MIDHIVYTCRLHTKIKNIKTEKKAEINTQHILISAETNIKRPTTEERKEYRKSAVYKLRDM